MRIAVISHNIYPCSLGGLEVFNYYFIKELAVQGHKIWIFTFCNNDWNNENIHHIKLWRGVPGLATLSIYCSIIINLIKLKNKIDIIHIPYTSNEPLAFPILFIKKLLHLPYVIVIHGGGMDEWKLKLLHGLFFKHAADIVAVSEIIGKEYEKRSGRKIKIIPPLLPFNESTISKSEIRNKYGISEKEIVILSLGTIKEIKGSDVLLEAFLSLGKYYIESNNLKLVYVGDGPMKVELEKITLEKNFSRHVIFFGSIPHKKVSEMYKLADIYIIPSLFEGKPISLLEAMFNGLTIIGSNVNGISNIITHKKNGVLFEKGNSDDLKNKIIEIIDNRNLARNLGDSAKNNYSKRYIFQNIISDHIKLYKEAIDLPLELNHREI
jgi:glycosyltransferase involved in cell wall biosynthesis